MQRSAIVWGSLLILLGGLFLLERLGYVTLELWPLLLPMTFIGIGLSIVLNAIGHHEELKVEHLTMELKGAESADIHFHFCGGELVVGGAAAPAELLAGTFIGGVQYKALDKGDSRIQLKLRLTDSGHDGGNREWRVALNPDLPLKLRFKTDGCKGVVDVGDMQVSELAFKVRAGEMDVALPTGAGFTKASITGNQSSFVLRIPEGVAASIRGTSILDEGESGDVRFLPVGDRFESPGYETAVNRIEIVVDVTAGSVKIA